MKEMVSTNIERITNNRYKSNNSYLRKAVPIAEKNTIFSRVSELCVTVQQKHSQLVNNSRLFICQPLSNAPRTDVCEESPESINQHLCINRRSSIKRHLQHETGK